MVLLIRRTRVLRITILSLHGVRVSFLLSCIVVLVVLVVLVGCSLDTRELRLAPGSGGESGAATQIDPGAGAPATAGANSAAGEAGALESSAGGGAGGGSSGSPSLLIDGCVDLDGNGIADCRETLVENPDFVSDVADWSPELDTTLTWDEENAAADSPSGSALLESTGVIDANTAGVALRVASQCLPVEGRQLVTVYANAVVDAGQDPQGHAEVDVFFFDAEKCAGGFTTSFSTPQPLDAMSGAWIDLKAGAVTGVNNQSVLVKLAISKPFRADSCRARFDNVLVKVQSP